MLAPLLVAIASSNSDAAEGRKPTEYEVKAAYLYSFGRFVKWPRTVAPSEFSICVYGSDPFGEALESTVAGESIDHKNISVKRISSAEQASNCQILFVSSSAEFTAGNLLAALKGVPVLTVSDMPGFLNHGGMIQFVMQGDRVRFQVNLAAAEKAGLNLSSELLKVAVEVKRDSEGGD